MSSDVRLISADSCYFCLDREVVSLHATERSLENTQHAWLPAAGDGTRPDGDCVPSGSWGRQEGKVRHIVTAKLLCRGWWKAISSVPHPNQTAAPSRAGSRISRHALSNGSVDESRCSSKAFPPGCLFSRVRFVPCFLFSLSSLPWTRSSRVLELVIYVEMVRKAFLS